MSEQHLSGLHLSTGAAALGALDPAERAAFEEHLAACETCREELAGFRETIVRLAATTEAAPGPALRDRVLEEIRRTPQLPPLVAEPGTRPRTDDPDDAADDDAGPPLASEVAGPETLPPEVLPPEVLPLVRRRRTLPWLIAAAAAIAIATPTGILLAGRDAPVPAAECVAEAEDVAVLLPQVGDGGQVARSATCDAAVVQMPPMPQAPDGQVYQLWLIDADQARPVGLVASEQEMVLADLRTGDVAVGVTLEPGPEGSLTPTSDPIWLVEL